jgi:hypothetical protein
MNSPRVTLAGSRMMREERGMALLIAVVLLLLMSALGISALQHAQDEASNSGRSRRKDATLYAAEAGLSMVQTRLLANWGAATPTAFTIDEPALVTDGFGNAIEVRSGTPADGDTAQAVDVGGSGSSEPPDGFMVNLGNQGAQSFRPVRADIVAEDATEGMVHLQAQYRIHEGSGGGSY